MQPQKIIVGTYNRVWTCIEDIHLGGVWGSNKWPGGEKNRPVQNVRIPSYIEKLKRRPCPVYWPLTVLCYCIHSPLVAFVV